jgi:O-glycosyl hydrolase
MSGGGGVCSVIKIQWQISLDILLMPAQKASERRTFCQGELSRDKASYQFSKLPKEERKISFLWRCMNTSCAKLGKCLALHLIILHS